MESRGCSEETEGGEERHRWEEEEKARHEERTFSGRRRTSGQENGRRRWLDVHCVQSTVEDEEETNEEAVQAIG